MRVATARSLLLLAPPAPGSDLVGAIEDLLGCAARRDRLELLEHRATGSDVPLGGHAATKPSEPSIRGMMVTKVRFLPRVELDEPGDGMTGLVHRDAPHLVGAESGALSGRRGGR